MANYLLLDTAQCLYFHKKLDKLGVRYESLFEGHQEAHFLELAPLLFELNRQEPAHQRLLKEIESIGSHNPALSIIDSSADLATLARHLRYFHLVGLPNSRQLLLRWYDTRILPTWLKVMTPHQQSGFMQNVNQWQYWDRYGELKNLYWEKSVHPISPPYHIGENQHQYLLNESQTDSAIAQMRRIIPQKYAKSLTRQFTPFLNSTSNQPGSSASILLMTWFNTGSWLYIHPATSLSTRQLHKNFAESALTTEIPSPTGR